MPLSSVQRAVRLEAGEQQYGWMGVLQTRMDIDPLAILLRSLGPTHSMLAAVSICRPMYQ